MPNFEFVDELPEMANRSLRSKPQQVFIDFADALRANPKQWAKYPKPLLANSVGTTTWCINHQAVGCPSVLRTGEFEAASRAGVLYVRFVGKA